MRLANPFDGSLEPKRTRAHARTRSHEHAHTRTHIRIRSLSLSDTHTSPYAQTHTTQTTLSEFSDWLVSTGENTPQARASLSASREQARAGQPLRLVRVRNPWGKKEWTGEFAKKYVCVLNIYVLCKGGCRGVWGVFLFVRMRVIVYVPCVRVSSLSLSASREHARAGQPLGLVRVRNSWGRRSGQASSQKSVYKFGKFVVTVGVRML